MKHVDEDGNEKFIAFPKKSKDDSTFCRIFEQHIEPEKLGGVDARLLLVLLRSMDHNNRCVWFSITALASAAGLSRCTTYIHLRRMTDAGFLKVIKAMGGGWEITINPFMVSRVSPNQTERLRRAFLKTGIDREESEESDE